MFRPKFKFTHDEVRIIVMALVELKNQLLRTLEARQMLKLGLANEMGNIFDLQDAIKANNSELAWLMEGEDPKPVKKEAAKNADDNRKPAEAAGPKPFGFGNNRS